MDLTHKIEEVKEKGFTVIESILSDKKIEEFKKCIYEVFSIKNNQKDEFHKGAQVVYNLQNKDLLFYRLICDKIVLDFANNLLKDGSYKNNEPFILCQSTARNPGPFGDEQQLHIDSNVPGLPFCFYMQAMWILDDFNVKSGGTRFVPGSHRLTNFAENNVRYENEFQVIAPRGSLIIFDGGVWHGGSKSHLNSDRWVIINTYCRWFLKQSFDIPRGLPKGIYNQLNLFQKKLLGFDCVPANNEEERKTRISKNLFNPYK